LAKTISWAPRAPEIRNHVEHSTRQTWRRPDIERLFEVRRATAQTLMKLIGELHLVGSTHVLDRSSLVAFLDEVLAAPTVTEGVRRRWLAVEPAPDGRGLRQLPTSLPPELHSIMARDLPPGITFAPGLLQISGATSVEILENLLLLAQALQNDLASVEALLDPPPAPQPVEDNELRSLFDRLRQDEQAWLRQRQANEPIDTRVALSALPRSSSAEK
jgi:hypothetical protein